MFAANTATVENHQSTFSKAQLNSFRIRWPLFQFISTASKRKVPIWNTDSSKILFMILFCNQQENLVLYKTSFRHHWVYQISIVAASRFLQASFSVGKVYLQFKYNQNASYYEMVFERKKKRSYRFSKFVSYNFLFLFNMFYKS